MIGTNNEFDLNTDQVIDRVLKGGHKVAIIYEGFLTNIGESKSYFAKFRATSPEDLVEQLKEFATNYHSTFTIMSRVSDGGGDKQLCQSKWDTRVTQEAKPQQPQNSVPEGMLTMAQVEAKMQAFAKDLANEMQMNQLKAQLEAKDAELNGMKSQGDKLAYVGLQILQGLNIGGSSLQPKVMQGVEDQTAEEAEEVAHDVTPEDATKQAEELAKAWETITEVVGRADIIALAESVKKDPSKLKMAIQMFK